MTHDVDVLFPHNPYVTKILKKLVDEVGAEFGLEHAPRDKWFNDSVNFIGLQSKSSITVFNHSHLVLKAADWDVDWVSTLFYAAIVFRDLRMALLC